MIIFDETGLTIILKGNEEEVAIQIADKMIDSFYFSHLILTVNRIIIEKTQQEIKKKASEL